MSEPNDGLLIGTVLEEWYLANREMPYSKAMAALVRVEHQLIESASGEAWRELEIRRRIVEMKLMWAESDSVEQSIRRQFLIESKRLGYLNIERRVIATVQFAKGSIHAGYADEAIPHLEEIVDALKTMTSAIPDDLSDEMLGVACRWLDKARSK